MAASTGDIARRPYAAPELLRPNCAYRGEAVDVWSSGVLLFSLAMGHFVETIGRSESVV